MAEGKYPLPFFVYLWYNKEVTTDPPNSTIWKRGFQIDISDIKEETICSI